MTPWLKDNHMEMYSAHDKGNSVVAESLIRYVRELADIVNKHNTTNHSTTKLKVLDVKPKTYIDLKKLLNVEKNDEDPKFEVVDHVRILKYKSIFVKSYTPN